MKRIGTNSFQRLTKPYFDDILIVLVLIVIYFLDAGTDIQNAIVENVVFCRCHPLLFGLNRLIISEFEARIGREKRVCLSVFVNTNCGETVAIGKNLVAELRNTCRNGDFADWCTFEKPVTQIFKTIVQRNFCKRRTVLEHRIANGVNRGGDLYFLKF